MQYKVETRKKIKTFMKLRKAFYLVSKKKSLAFITVKELCEVAEVARSTFYIYYDNIDAFYVEVASEILQSIDNVLNRIDPGLVVSNLEKENQYYIKRIDNFTTYLEFNRDKILPFIYPSEYFFFVSSFKAIMNVCVERQLKYSGIYRNIKHFVFALNIEIVGVIIHWLIYNNMSKTELVNLSVEFREKLIGKI